MAKFGLFNVGGTKPVGEYEGEYLELNSQGQSVCVMAPDGKGGQHAVAVVRLSEGQSVKKIE